MRSSSFGQVGFNYDAPQNSNVDEKSNDVDDQEESDEAYCTIENFYIPPDILLPTSMKEHARIEKTAKFISTQGAQMEILIKTKQANNSQFDFLNQSNRLYPYYKHILNAIKNGEFPEKKPPPNTINTDNFGNDDNSNHLNHSFTSSLHVPRTTVSTITYKPSANCSYTQLISKIKGVPLPSDLTTSTLSPPIVSATVIQTESLNQTSIPPTQPPVTQSVPEIVVKNNLSNNTNHVVEVKKISGGLMLAQYYNSDSESENENDSENNEVKIPMPPEILQNIIDKTAVYVIKNGKNFEDILRTKDPVRFSFLDDTCEYHHYYRWKVTGQKPKLPIKSVKKLSSPKPISEY